MKTAINLGSDYKRIIDIRPCPNIKSFDLTIKDQMLNAKNPDELQTKFQWVMSRNDLYALRETISAALSEEHNEKAETNWIEP